MTLIIAGYEYRKDEYAELFSEKESEAKVCGIFAHADSAITTGDGKVKKTLLTEFQKLYQFDVKLWKPHFDAAGAFSGYREIHQHQDLLVGFAGSTLTAQHILNSIGNHTAQLRISHAGKIADSPIVYNVVRHCGQNPLEESVGTVLWGDCTFTQSNQSDLLTGDVVSDCVEHSINHALASAKKYKFGDEFYEMKTDIFSAFWCAKKRCHELYAYKMKFEEDIDGFAYPCTTKELVDERCVAVLGMEARFATRAQDTFDQALANSACPSVEMKKFLEASIDEVRSGGGNDISTPVFSRNVDQAGRITR